MIERYLWAVFVNIESFTSWIWLLVPLVLLVVFYLFRFHSTRGLSKFLFPKKIYCSSSFRDDIGINVAYLIWGFLSLPLGFSLQAFTSVAMGKLCLLVLPAVQLNLAPWSPWALWVAFALVSDFGNFLNHYLMHRLPLLWQFHKVHHAAEVLNPLTQFRSHPVEPICREIVIGATMGLFSAALIWCGVLSLDRLPVGGYLGVYILYYATIHFRHSHHWISFGPLSYVFSSPSMHQIHHSIEPVHRGKNYAVVFSLWDLLFGSFYLPKHKEEFRIGLEDPEERRAFRGLMGNFLTPFRLVFKRRRRQWDPFGSSVRAPT